MAARNLALAGAAAMGMLAALRFISIERTLLYGAVPLAPVASILGLVIAGALTRRRAFGAATAVSALAVGLFLPGTVLPRTGCDVTTGSPDELVVFSHNVRIGNGNVDGVVAQARSVSPDVVLLQESAVDFAEAVFAELADDYPHAIWEGNQSFVSRWPVTERRSVELVPGTKPVLIATVHAPGGEITVANFHSDPPFKPALRANQIEQFNTLADDPRFHDIDLLMGDFNAPSADKRYRELRATRYIDAHRSAGCGFGTTWSPRANAVPPLFSLDHALLANGFDASSFDIFDFAGSDHRAIAVRITGP